MRGLKYLIVWLFISVAILFGCDSGSSSSSSSSSASSSDPGAVVPDSGKTRGGTANSYTDNGDGTITDGTTGLIWQKCSAGFSDSVACADGSATYNWYEATGKADATYNAGGATDVCGSLTLGGSSAWRLPTKSELLGIVNYETSTGPGINTTYFPNTVSSWYWSATTSAPESTSAWYVFFGGGTSSGGINDVKRSYTFNVRCVR